VGNQHIKFIYQDYDLQSYRNKVEKLSQPLIRNLGLTFWQNVRCGQKSAHLYLDVITQFEISKMQGIELGGEEDLSIEERGHAFEKVLALKKDPSLLKELSRRVEIRLRALKEIDEDLSETLDSINSGSVIQLWCALEFLAAELWSATVDSRPRSLGVAAAEWALKHPLLVLSDWQRRQLGRAFSEDYFRVGKFLRENILDFSSAKRISGYYRAVFPGAVLDDWIRPAAKIQAARNVLLHNGGVVNGQFLRLASGLLLVKGTQLKFWSVQVHGFSAATMGLGLILLQAVDGWLASHPGDSHGHSASVH
jgi:hypothetical protein